MELRVDVVLQLLQVSHHLHALAHLPTRRRRTHRVLLHQVRRLIGEVKGRQVNVPASQYISAPTWRPCRT